ncbi:MAG: carbamate kinase [Anaerolineaceae bacterium]|nr:carbamate kinase [Anaerolineaceae bacterium]
MQKKGLAVVAVGGNALILDKNHQTIPDQFNAAVKTVKRIADMIADGWDVVITHGNGPQVGFILRRSELAAHELHQVPLDYCGADTEGSIGYMFQQALYNEFRERGIQKQAATVITQTIVDSKDPAFQNPTKPIGSFMDEELAMKKREKEGWTVVEDAGRGWRRVVPSPIPQTIVEADAIRTLIDNGFVVVAVGGGGIPVMQREDGSIVGLEAVIDKDFGSAILASMIGADLFLISTAVEKVAINFNKPNQQWLDVITVAEAQKLIEEGHFARGSMLPKIEAILKYMAGGGKKALITDPAHIKDALDGKTGTWIVP